MTTVNHCTATWDKVKHCIAVPLFIAAAILLSIILASITGPDPVLAGVNR